MELALTGPSALAVLRALRTGTLQGGFPEKRADLVSPSPHPFKRWVRRAIDLGSLSSIVTATPESPLHVVIPTAKDRIRVPGVHCTLIEHGLPKDSFVPIDDRLLIPCPELLFLEMGRHMDPLPHLMLGLELCGTFSRDPIDPLGGTAALNIEPVTSADTIRGYMASSKVRGHGQARSIADSLADGSWSPGEGLVAAFAALPFGEVGYGIGPISLNHRQEPPGELRDLMAKGSRVPDILLAGTTVGINYDGEGHLDLAGMESVIRELDLHPENAAIAREYERVRRAIREKYVDDRRRDRELGVAGLTVLVATKEDLYEPGAFDRLMGQCTYALQRTGVKGLDCQMSAFGSKAIRRMRRRMLDDVLVGRSRKGVII